jgi:hypothetical protein
VHVSTASRRPTVAPCFGDFLVNKHLLGILAGCVFQLLAVAAYAHSSYDGPWNITFVTQSGDCSPTYNYTVDIENGVLA